MNRRRINLFTNCHMASFASIVLGITVFLLPGISVGQDFQGSEFCQGCHEVEYNQWKVSGHPYKLTKSEQARNRPIPLPGGFSWDDISYVIGGYKWKSRYIDTDGYIITTTKDEDGNDVPGVNQYNYLTGKWSDYKAGEENKPYNCGACHTTNWVANENPEDLSGNQDGLPGIHGTFDAGGIQCEQCHGNGMTKRVDDSVEFCGTCHIRGDADAIPAKGGFIRHREQGNEFLASSHSDADLTCVSCHNPHKRAEFSIIKECSDCHSEEAEAYASNAMANYDVECEDCHMPYASKSAQALGQFKGDQRTHIFSINTDPDANMFTPDGKFVALDDAGKAAVTLDFACQRCHQKADINELAKFAKNFHDQTLDEIGLNPGLTGHWWGGQDRDGEGFFLDFSFSNGSLVLAASFYTYDDLGNQAWLIATGPATTGTTATVNVFITEGRMWGDAFDPSDGEEIPWGTAAFTFPNCSVGLVSLMPNQAHKDKGFTDLSYDLNRDLMVSAIQCPTFVNNAP